MEARRQRTAYLGPEASFSHQAAVEALPHTEAIPLPSFKAILQALQEAGPERDDHYDYAVLPVENSTNGSVVQALDLLAQCGLDPTTSSYPDVEVVAEHYLEVHHCLFVSRAWATNILNEQDMAYLSSYDNDGTYAKTNGAQNGHAHGNGPGSEAKTRDLRHILEKLTIKTLYTHPQVWGQCNNILSALLPPGHVERIDTSSTSAAAALVAGTKGGSSAGIAAISSSLAGTKHSKELLCIAIDIEDEPGANTTRFLVLRNRNRTNDDISLPSIVVQNSAQIKSLWTFTIAHHVPGSLATTLAVFAKHGFNLSAIQSRPRPRSKGSDQQKSRPTVTREQDRNWQYVFFVECLHSIVLAEQGGVKVETLGVLKELKNVTQQVSLLGSWNDQMS